MPNDNFYNIVPKSKVLKFIKSIVKSNLNKKADSIIQIRKDKLIYKVICGKNTFRIDTDKRYLFGLEEQKIAFENGINVPKILYYSGKPSYRILEWIDGDNCLTLWNDKNYGKLIIIALAEQLGKMNNIRKDNLYLTNGELNIGNYVLTFNQKLYIIDNEKMRFVETLVPSISKLLLKRIKRKPRIDLFLSEYSKYSNYDISEIIKFCEVRGWKWRSPIV